MNKGEYSIKIKNLSKSFGNAKAVDNLNLNVKKGEMFGFLGPNGAGKTTTLKMLAGLTKPDKGEIFLSGEKANFTSVKARKMIGYLPDVPNPYGYMTAYEFLHMAASLFDFETYTIDKKILKLLDLVGIKNDKKRIGAYSRGMKQRIGIAQALINEPDIVLMDEPISTLDPQGRFEIIEILKKLKGETTIFFSTHIISDIEKICDSVAIIKEGVLVGSGSITELKGKYDNKKIRFKIPSWYTMTNIESFQSKLLSMSWCEDLEKRSNNEFILQTGNRSLTQKEIVNLFSEFKVPLESMDSVTVSLEEIFLEVIQR